MSKKIAFCLLVCAFPLFVFADVNLITPNTVVVLNSETRVRPDLFDVSCGFTRFQALINSRTCETGKAIGVAFKIKESAAYADYIDIVADFDDYAIQRLKNSTVQTASYLGFLRKINLNNNQCSWLLGAGVYGLNSFVSDNDGMFHYSTSDSEADINLGIRYAFTDAFYIDARTHMIIHSLVLQGKTPLAFSAGYSF